MSATRDGFSLIEVIIAMMILTVGILAMGASTGYVLNQVSASELRTERAVAVRQAAETLLSMPEADLLAGCESDLELNDRFTVRYECTETLINMIRVRLIVDGPAYAGRSLDRNAVDTTMLNVRR